MATTVNRVLANALRGQSVIVTLDASETATKLADIIVGMKATISSSGKIGYVDSVDYYGHSYTVEPRNPDLRFESTALGFLSVSETITLV